MHSAEKKSEYRNTKWFDILSGRGACWPSRLWAVICLYQDKIYPVYEKMGEYADYRTKHFVVVCFNFIIGEGLGFDEVESV